ncbi:MAG TPA: DUF454 domain-containing protein [Thioploca sp.]|nr:MAG: DUF454 domain-containing protein [Gammaproteobacteria bacterium]HDN26544.1 DUF454 domain-containing protein [Thioploca sp.]
MSIYYKLLGFIFVGLAALGVFLPLLPTTPFLLIAAGCFAKSSDKWHQWLLSNRIFGPLIKNWHEKKCISTSTKRIAISSIVVFGGYSILFAVSDVYLRVLGSLVIATGLFFVSRLKVCRKESAYSFSDK